MRETMPGVRDIGRAIDDYLGGVIRCGYRCLAPDGAQCELAVDHLGPHRNGGLIWHDPPMLFVDGKPYVPPADPVVSETSD